MSLMESAFDEMLAEKQATCDRLRTALDAATADALEKAYEIIRLRALAADSSGALERLQADYDELDEAARAVLDHVDRGGHQLAATAGALQGVLYAHAHPEEVKQVAAALAGQASEARCTCPEEHETHLVGCPMNCGHRGCSSCDSAPRAK